MSRHGRHQIRMVGMLHNNMPSACDDVEAIGAIPTSKVVLSPAKGRLTPTGAQCVFACHTGKLSTEQQTDAIRSHHLAIKRCLTPFLSDSLRRGAQEQCVPWHEPATRRPRFPDRTRRRR
jgi:hypothetical protein